MAKKKVFISFDWDNDRNYRYLLSAFSKNPANDIEFVDSTPSEIQTNDIGTSRCAVNPSSSTRSGSPGVFVE